MKYSKQREKIINVLYENKIHPTAEKIYSLLCEKGEKISLATVYRNLKTLTDAGVIRRIKTSEKTERFDSTLSPHYHFLCDECKNVFDIPCHITSDVSKNIELLGYEVTKYDMMITGICPQCKRNTKLKSTKIN